MLGGNIPHKAM